MGHITTMQATFIYDCTPMFCAVVFYSHPVLPAKKEIQNQETTTSMHATTEPPLPPVPQDLIQPGSLAYGVLTDPSWANAYGVVAAPFDAAATVLSLPAQLTASAEQQCMAGSNLACVGMGVGIVAQASLPLAPEAAALEEGTALVGETSASQVAPAGNAATSGSAASTLANNNAVGKAAEQQVVAAISSQPDITVQTQVTLRSGTTSAIADAAVSGAPNAAVQIPPGYVAEDINGNILTDANGDPITSFNLNSQGKAVVEVKTGGATLTTNQSIVYPSVQEGTAVGTGAGTNAGKAGISGALPQTPVIVLRKL